VSVPSSTITSVPATPAPKETIIPESTYIAPEQVNIPATGQGSGGTVQPTAQTSPSPTTTPQGMMVTPAAMVLAFALIVYFVPRTRR
jgi:hypothetical protein